MREAKPRKTPTLRSQWLGHQLRELREQNGLTLRQVAEYLQRNFSALSRFETAEWPIPRGDVLLLLDLYGVADEKDRARLIHLSEDVWRKDEWDAEYGDVVERSFIDYPWLEARAKMICSYNTMLVPGLLQTKAYAEAVIRNAEEAASDEKIGRWLELRIERQRVLDESPPKKIVAIIEESVLRRPIGSGPTMHEQLDHLGRLARRPNINVLVLPTQAGLHAGLDGTFTLFKMPDPYPEVAYIENLGGRLYMESPKSERFVRAYDRLREAALSASESAKLIAALAEDLS